MNTPLERWGIQPLTLACGHKLRNNYADSGINLAWIVTGLLCPFEPFEHGLQPVRLPGLTSMWRVVPHDPEVLPSNPVHQPSPGVQ